MAQVKYNPFNDPRVNGLGKKQNTSTPQQPQQQQSRFVHAEEIPNSFTPIVNPIPQGDAKANIEYKGEEMQVNNLHELAHRVAGRLVDNIHPGLFDFLSPHIQEIIREELPGNFKIPKGLGNLALGFLRDKLAGNGK